MGTNETTMIEGYICATCDEPFPADDAGPSLYECGMDGEFTSDEGNRCPMCSKFSRTVTDLSCPHCEGEVSVIDRATLWLASDGTAHTSEHAAKAWDADAPKREAQAEAALKAREARMNEYDRRREAWRARVRPMIDPLLGRSPMDWTIDLLDEAPGRVPYIEVRRFCEWLGVDHRGDWSAVVDLFRSHGGLAIADLLDDESREGCVGFGFPIDMLNPRSDDEAFALTSEYLEMLGSMIASVED